MGMEWISRIGNLYLWNHPKSPQTLHILHFKYAKPHVSLPYQSNRGSQVILIRLKWGVLSVSHIFLEQLGTGITPLSSGTTHKFDCMRQRKGPCCDKKAKLSPSRYCALIPQVSLEYQSLIDSPDIPRKYLMYPPINRFFSCGRSARTWFNYPGDVGTPGWKWLSHQISTFLRA